MEGADRVRDYFRVKAQQLLASAALAAPTHAGLAGSHREEVLRIYLSEVLPRRYGVGRGIVYGSFKHSREADIVLWDELNFPVLPLAGQDSFFAEAVRVVIESKTRWSSTEFADVLAKTRAVRSVLHYSGPNLDETLQMLRLNIEALRTGREHHGILRVPHKIGTAAVFISGGQTAFADGNSYGLDDDDIDSAWPDVLLLLTPGRLVLKSYDEQGGILQFFDLGSDALLAFTNAMYVLLGERSVHIEQPFFLRPYAEEVLGVPPTSEVRFSVAWPPQGRPIWKS